MGWNHKCWFVLNFNIIYFKRINYMDLIEKRKQTFCNNNILENMTKIPEILERKIFEFIPLGNLKILNHEYLNKFFDYNFYCF